MRGFNIRKENCKIRLGGLFDFQLVFYDIKINTKVHELYQKSKVKFCQLT